MPFRLTKLVKILLIANVAVFIIQQTMDLYLGGNFVGWFGLIPYRVVMYGWFWQVFTYAFLHADPWHLLFNMLILAVFGSELEARWGKWEFLRYYLICAVVAASLYLFFQVFTSSGLHVPMVGASGGIYGLLIAYGLIFAERQMLFMMMFPMKAKHFIWILVGIELLTTLFSAHGRGWSGLAHLGGMAGGFAYLWIKTYWQVRQKLKDSPWFKKVSGKRRASSKHLKLVINNPEEKASSKPPSDKNDPTWH